MDLTPLNLLAVIVMIAIATFYLAKGKSRSLSKATGQALHSLPTYHGILAGIYALVPGLLLLSVFVVCDGIVFKQWVSDYYPAEVISAGGVAKEIAFAKVMNAVQGINMQEAEPWAVQAGQVWLRWQESSDRFTWMTVLIISVLGAALSYYRVTPQLRARNEAEAFYKWVLWTSSLVAILTTIGIVLSVLFESIRFFQLIPIQDFIFGLEWNPQFEGAERAGSGNGTATYGMVPMFVGTLLISVIALSVAVPVGLFSAIYLAEYASPRARAILKPVLEILAGVPTVVYGFFAALTVAPFIKDIGAAIGLEVAAESALAAGLVMGVMIIPFVSSLSDDVINAVPQSLRDASYGLGSTKSESIRLVVIPAALPGIVAAVILAVSRAIGETMIVVMAAGLAANLSFNPLDAVTTVTSQIVTILVGDQEFESAKTLSAFALALMLIIITLGLNYFALKVVKKYREQYE